MSLRLGSLGAEVGALQQRLIELGYTIPSDELSRQRFGPDTEAAVRDFQARHPDPYVLRPLVDDGIVGPATAAALERSVSGVTTPYRPTNWRWEEDRTPAELRRVIEWAFSMVGTVENPPGSNRGREIDVWTGLAGKPITVLGPPWCAYFVSAAYSMRVGGSPFGRLGSTYKLLEWARAHDRILPDVVPPRPGDVFCILRTRFSGHTGLITGTILDAPAQLGSPPVERLCTVEGNSGNAVRCLIRPRPSLTAIVRPVGPL